MKLNKEQLEAVNSTDRFIFLLAGAGSGKTRVIIEKINKLINDGVAPESILAITFTRKAALEMKNRLNNAEVNVSTFHSFCYQILTIKYEVLKVIDPEATPFSKRELLEVSTFKNALNSHKPPLIYFKYQSYLANKNALDFDDLLIEFLKLDETEIPQYQYIFIDEFQDTNNLQYEVLKLLITPNNYIFAVGDPDQSIYAFRGANPQIISRYIKDYFATLLKLNINYRSYKNIVDQANYLISLNKLRLKKELEPNNQKNGIIKHLSFETIEDETSFIFSEIKVLMKRGYKLNEMAILYRNHQRSAIFERSYINSYLYEVMPRLNLLTIHQAKGLEFRVVFLIGLEHGVLPTLFENKISELEEERRLLFVAITRAMEKLYLSCVEKNQFSITKKPSKFLSELRPFFENIS